MENTEIVASEGITDSFRLSPGARLSSLPVLQDVCGQIGRGCVTFKGML